MQKLYISREGLDKLHAELEVLNARRLKVAEAIEHARGLGDLSENAEYHSAKEEQGMLHAKIADLEDKISRSVVLDNQEFDKDKAYQGATVKVRNKHTDRKQTYTLVNQVETDIANGRISVQSPVGKALLGKCVGEVAAVKAPAGDLTLEILEIRY